MTTLYTVNTGHAQCNGKRERGKGGDLLETSLRVLEEQENELQEARDEKERTERENRQLRHQMENLCSDLGISGSVCKQKIHFMFIYYCSRL